MPCAEAPPVVDPPTRPKCVKRQVTLKLPKRAKKVRATVNGKKVAGRIVKGKLKLWLPKGDRKRTVVVIKGRNKSGKKIQRRYDFKGCGPKR